MDSHASQIAARSVDRRYQVELLLNCDVILIVKPFRQAKRLFPSLETPFRLAVHLVAGTHKLLSTLLAGHSGPTLQG